MRPVRRFFAVGFLLVCCAVIGAEPARLPAEQMAKAIRNDSISIPTPGELFAALEKPGKPNWVGQMRVPVATSYKNRPQIALNLGTLIADGFIAVEAQDNVLSRGNSINEFAENDEWDALQEELEATQNEVKSSMQSHRDQDLIILVSVGGWIRGTQVVSAAVMQNYDERAAKVLRQPALVNFIQSKLNEVSPDVRDEPLVKEVSGELPGLEKLVTFPVGKAPTADEVRKVNEAVGKIMSKIQSKEAK